MDRAVRATVGRHRMIYAAEALCDPTTWPDAMIFSVLIISAAAVLISLIRR